MQGKFGLHWCKQNISCAIEILCAFDQDQW